MRAKPKIKLSLTEQDDLYIVDIEVNKCSYELKILKNLTNIKSELAVAGLSNRTRDIVIGLIEHEVSML